MPAPTDPRTDAGTNGKQEPPEKGEDEPNHASPNSLAPGNTATYLRFRWSSLGIGGRVRPDVDPTALGDP